MIKSSGRTVPIFKFEGKRQCIYDRRLDILLNYECVVNDCVNVSVSLSVRCRSTRLRDSDVNLLVHVDLDNTG